MEHIEISRHFNVPAERAYGFVTDPHNWPRFIPGLISVDPVARYAAPGDTAAMTTKLLGRQRRVEMTIERLEPNRYFAYSSRQDGLPVAHHERIFSPDADGFTLKMSVAYEARSGIRGLLDRILVTPAVRRLFVRTLDALATALA
jgi:uncharacterized protein YndB with AHSA1/START domain